MPIDPSIALGYRGITAPNPLNQLAQVSQIQSAQQANQLNQMKIAEAQRALADENALREATKGIDYSTPEGQQAYGQAMLKVGDIKGYHTLQTAIATQSEAERKARTAQLTNAATKGKLYNDALTNISDPQGVIAWYTQQAADPDMQGSPVYGMKPEDIKKEVYMNSVKKQKDGSFVFDPNAFNNYKQSLQLGLKEHLDVLDKQAQRAETERAHRAGEKLARERFEAEREKGNYSPETIDYLAEIYNQTGTLPTLGLGASGVKMQIINRARELGTAGGASIGEAATSVVQAKQTKAAEQSTLKGFTSGVEARRVTANNTAINHLETMDRLVNDLANSDIRVVNKAANAFAKETGGAAPTNFDAAKQIVAAEVIKAVVQNGGGVTERQEAAEQFARANSPAQLKGVINTYKDLLGGQLQSLKQQYEFGTKRKDFDQRLTPNTRKLLTPAEDTKKYADADVDAALAKYK